MNNFKIKKEGTIIGKSISLDAVFSNFLIKLIFFSIWLFGFASILIIVDYYTLKYLQNTQLFGLSLVMISVFLFYLAERGFYLGKIKTPELFDLTKVEDEITKGKDFNLFNIFSFELAKATANLWSKETVTSGELSSAILSSHDMDFILARAGISRDTLSEYVKNYKGKLTVAQIVEDSLDVAILESHHQIEIGDIFVALCKEEFITKFLDSYKLSAQDIANIVYWQTVIVRKMIREKKHLDPTKLRLTGGIGRDWAFGWTPFLSKFSSDITREIESNNLELGIIGRDKEINEIKEALIGQNGGNAIVVGEPGVGKRTVVMGFAKKVTEGETYSFLDHMHIVNIDLDFLLAGISAPGDITARISGILNEVAAAGNIIVYIENVQNLLSSGDAGKIDATEVILPFLELPNIHVLATCDIANYNKYIATNSALSQRFSRVNIEEPNEKEMIRILEDSLPLLEYRSKCLVSYEALKEIIKSADRYIMNLPNPEKSINLLDNLIMHIASERGKTIIMPEDVDTYVSTKFNVPAGDASTQEKEKLLSIDQIMHERIIGQNEAINAIANALRRARAGVEDNKKPIGSFLFLGPTGVGKTETAKALAKAYFGAENRMIRFDMSEYQNQADIYRFIGSNIQGEAEQGALTVAVREQPFSLLLFDEIEKAHKEILDLFLQMLDEGFITDGLGRKVSFANTIIIATSNAGSSLIRESIENGSQYSKVKSELLKYLQEQNIYRPEFLNRFTQVIAFSPLSKDEIAQVAALMIAGLKAALKKNKGITVNVESRAVAKLAELGYDPQMGARPMARVIQEKIEDLLATKILSGDLNKGDSYTVTLSDIS